MVSLSTVFWVLLGFFAIIGASRGWTREVIATSGLVLSLFALNQFGFFLINAFVRTPEAGGAPIARQQFYLLTTIHLLIAFFSYQGPALAGRRLSERLRIRDSLQDKLLGGLIGGLNGYLVIGTIWSFLEYRLIATAQWIRLDPGVPYPFDSNVMVRPEIDSAMAMLMSNLPFPFLAPYLPILVVVVFLFVLVVMI